MEIYKSIKGYENLYDVSNCGNVYSHITNKTMKHTVSSSGYAHVQLYKDGKAKTHLVHKLVASTFLDNSNEKEEVNHKDGDKLNNNADNLEWVSRKENIKHAIDNGLFPPPPRIAHPDSYKNCTRKILQYTLDGQFVKLWDSISSAARFYSCSHSSISGCLRGKKKSCRDFMWRSYNGGHYDMKIEPIQRGIANQTGAKRSRRFNRKRHTIYQYTKDNKLIRIWNDYNDITNELGYSNGNIYKCINGKLKSAYGYIWKYGPIFSRSSGPSVEPY